MKVTIEWEGISVTATPNDADLDQIEFMEGIGGNNLLTLSFVIGRAIKAVVAGTEDLMNARLEIAAHLAEDLAEVDPESNRKKELVPLAEALAEAGTAVWNALSVEPKKVKKVKAEA